MQFFTDSNMQFPLVELSLNQGETVFIQRGSMVYHTPNVTLSTKLNASGSGLGRFVKAVGRSMVSGESSFITQVVSQSNNGYIALAPDSPGQVIPLYLGEKQYRLNDGAFLALDGTAYYTMELQSVGKALFGGQGGFFVMTTQGQGTLLANAYGSIKKIELNNQEVTIDNAHVVAWRVRHLIIIFTWKMVSGSLLGQERVLLIPLEEQVKFMFKVSIFKPLHACLIDTCQNAHNTN